MFYLKDAIWQISLGEVLRMEVMRQLINILPGADALKFSNGLLKSPDIIVGTPAGCDEIKHAVIEGLVDLNGFGPDDHLLKSINIDGKACVVIAGLTDRAAVYGIFSFFEEIGFSFLASRTVCPETGLRTLIPEIDIKFATKNKWRGMFVSFCMVSTSIMSLADFSNLFDNMFRMKLNRIIFYPFENEPIIDYTYKSERKLVGDISRPESGYFSYGRHWTGSFCVDDISVGREKFSPRRRVAPMEFQDVSTSDEALDMGKSFMNRIIAMATERQIGVWISFLPQFVSMNMTKHIKSMPRKNMHWSALVSCTDSSAREINACRIKNMIESYPELEGIFIGIPEGFYEDPHDESREYIKSQLAGYEEALELQKKYWGDHWPGDELQRKHIEADIAFSKIAVETLNDAASIKPGIRLGLLTICKAYLLTKLHKIIPKDVAFCDIESRSLWTHAGAPLFLFKEMKGRECSIIPRITDDGSQAGMQFNLGLYHKDGYCRSTVLNGTAGLMMQTLFINGADHNIKYLADGLWNPEISPGEFYKKHLKLLYGDVAAGKIKKAYEILEDNEDFMGGRGAANMPWNHVPPEIAVMRSFKDFNNPFHACPLGNDFVENSIMRAAIYEKAADNLIKAAEIFASALDECIKSGRTYCRYMQLRTKAYAAHLETLVLLSELYAKYINLFSSENISFKMMKLTEMAGEANKHANETAGLFAQCILHTTDLAPLWMINSSMVKGTEVLLQYLLNILAYYQGGEYWNPVGWDELFGECPYPSHGVEINPVEDKSSDEPG